MLSTGNYQDRDRQTDRPSEGVMRALLAPSRQANGWVDRPMVGCLDRQQGTSGQVNMAQAGRQSKQGRCSWGLPCEGCGIPPATACWGLGLWLEFGVHHAESWPACGGKQSRWLLVGKQVGGWGGEEDKGLYLPESGIDEDRRLASFCS